MVPSTQGRRTTDGNAQTPVSVWKQTSKMGAHDGNQGSNPGAITLCIWVGTFTRSGGRRCVVYLWHPKQSGSRLARPGTKQPLKTQNKTEVVCGLPRTYAQTRRATEKRRSSHTSKPQHLVCRLDNLKHSCASATGYRCVASPCACLWSGCGCAPWCRSDPRRSFVSAYSATYLLTVEAKPTLDTVRERAGRRDGFHPDGCFRSRHPPSAPERCIFTPLRLCVSGQPWTRFRQEGGGTTCDTSLTRSVLGTACAGPVSAGASPITGLDAPCVAPPLHGPKCKVSIMAWVSYMATLFGGEAWDECLTLGQAKTYTQLSTQIPIIFCIQ